jgi:hypothetical protein
MDDQQSEPLCADSNCGCPRYAHRCDLKTGRYSDCLRCRKCLGYQSVVLNRAILGLRQELTTPQKKEGE